MVERVLQKTAELRRDDVRPGEVLNPIQATGKYRARIAPPSTDLAPFVDHYWMLEWDRRNAVPHTCEVIPSPVINMTFSPAGSTVTGVTTGRYSYELRDSGAIFGVKFRPGGFHPFWRHPLSRLTDRVIPTATIFESIDTDVNAALCMLATLEERVGFVERLLRGMSPEVDPQIDLIDRIIAAIDAESLTSVGAVARRFGLSERSLQSLFQTRVGVGIKWIMLRFRLQRAAAIAAAEQSPNWGRVAVDLGYADQSHFTNDFTRIIGTSPARYAARARGERDGGAP